MDDIIVIGKLEQKYLNSLRQVFKRSYEAGFKLNLEKCYFSRPEIKYLSHIIDLKGIRKNNEKVEAILKIRAPRNVSMIKTYLGMINIMQSLLCI